MKFNFSFQKVLDVKEREKELAQHEYGVMKRRQMELHEQIEGLEMAKEKVFDQYNEVNRKTVWEILEVHEDIKHVELQMKKLEHQSQQIVQEVEQRQQALFEKSKEAKMWNKWKEKSKDAFEKQLIKKEQTMLDEMAVLQYFRRG
jgi:flagellar protein FliJ